MAIIGDTGKFCPALAEKLVQQKMHLIFVSNEAEKNVQIMEQLEQKYPSAEIEFVNCEKEGCWEADMIAFTYFENIDPELIQRIKVVATQKIVLVVSEKISQQEEIKGTNSTLDQLLPHSRVVRIKVDQEAMKATIAGKDDEARETVKEFFEEAGYEL